MVDWAKPVGFQVISRSSRPHYLRGAYGMDDWKQPSEFVVRLDHVDFQNEDEQYSPVARFDHNGHSVFLWNPPQDGFHIDAYENGSKRKLWLQTPPPHTNLLDAFDYCRGKLFQQTHVEYLFEVYCGREVFNPAKIGLNPVKPQP